MTNPAASRGSHLFSMVPYDFENEGLDPEGPSPADLERFGDEFRTCPECGSDVYDQAEMCPKCGRAFEHHTSTPVWLIPLVVFVLVVFVLVYVF